MDYFSIDIETTGLDPERDQILQIGAVYAPDSMKYFPVEELPSFSVLIRHARIEGDPFALSMNAGLLKRLADKQGVDPLEAANSFRTWCYGVAGIEGPINGGNPPKFTAAGKNFAGFDRQFLKALSTGIDRMFRHRVIDPAVLYTEDGDQELPSTEICVSRLANDKPMADMRKLTVVHDALDDARLIVRLIRHRMGGRVF